MSREVIPFAWYDPTSNRFFKNKDDAPVGAQVWPLYLQLDKREWVGLTDEEIAEAIGAEPDDIYLADFRKVEAKLKEKNNG